MLQLCTEIRALSSGKARAIELLTELAASFVMGNYSHLKECQSMVIQTWVFGRGLLTKEKCKPVISRKTTDKI